MEINKGEKELIGVFLFAVCAFVALCLVIRNAAPPGPEYTAYPTERNLSYSTCKEIFVEMCRGDGNDYSHCQLEIVTADICGHLE